MTSELRGAEPGAPAHPVVDEAGGVGPGSAGGGDPDGMADQLRDWARASE